VHDAVVVTVLDTGDDLMEEVPRLVGVQAAFCHDVVKELPVGDVLHDDENIGWCVDDLIEADDVRVTALLKDVYLALNLFGHVELCDAVPIQDLDRDMMSGNDVGGI